MYDNVKKTIAILFLVLLLSAAFAPNALAWGPPGRDGWYLGPNGAWHQGAPWGPPSYGYQVQQWYPESYSGCWGQYRGSGYYDGRCAPTQPYPAPQPYVQVQPAPLCPVEPCYTWEPPIVPDRCSSWGTFGSYDHWAHEFYREHGRYPNDQDVRDFWYSQSYAAHHCGQSPWW